MKNKRFIVWLLVFGLLFSGCANLKNDTIETIAPTDNVITVATEAPDTMATEPTKLVKIIMPLPDTTMENLNDAILSVSLEEDKVYVDDEGAMKMDLKIYTYDKYDMVDIADLEVGNILVRHSGEVVVESVERKEFGTIYINGGLENGGFDLVTDEDGVFYEMGYSDTKSWYEIGETTIRVSADFEAMDTADLEQGEVIYYPGDFLVGAVTNYDFTPYNTTVRVEGGQIVELNRVYIP